MLKNILFAAMCAFCLAVAGLVCVVGGCGNGAAPAVRKQQCPIADDTKIPESIPNVSIGDNAGSVGRLEEPASVTATLYHADGVRDDSRRVNIEPGTWLIPARVFATPYAPDPESDDAE